MLLQEFTLSFPDRSLFLYSFFVISSSSLSVCAVAVLVSIGAGLFVLFESAILDLTRIEVLKNDRHRASSDDKPKRISLSYIENQQVSKG